MKVRFNYADRKLSFTPKAALKEMVIKIFSKENTTVETIDYIFCSDEYLLQINRNALNHDYYTDIITFPLHEKGMPIQAEIYISIDRVQENATTHNTLFGQEIARVIAHGALHLCGYRDKSKADITLMREKEVTYIKNI
jgi:rRNA maturation RNase YbeY